MALFSHYAFFATRLIATFFLLALVVTSFGVFTRRLAKPMDFFLVTSGLFFPLNIENSHCTTVLLMPLEAFFQEFTILLSSSRLSLELLIKS